MAVLCNLCAHDPYLLVARTSTSNLPKFGNLASSDIRKGHILPLPVAQCRSCNMFFSPDVSYRYICMVTDIALECFRLHNKVHDPLNFCILAFRRKTVTLERHFSARYRPAVLFWGGNSQLLVSPPGRGSLCWQAGAGYEGILSSAVVVILLLPLRSPSTWLLPLSYRTI